MSNNWYIVNLSDKVQTLGYRSYIEFMHTCKNYLYDTVGEDAIGWNYTSVPTDFRRKLIFYIQSQEHATAFKLKFG